MENISILLYPMSKKQITKIPNPKLEPQLLQCHIHQNYHSRVPGGPKCHYKCKVGGKTYEPGNCPSCKSSCSFVWDRLKNQQHLQYFALEKVQKETTPNGRKTANDYLDNLAGIRNDIHANALRDIGQLRDDGGIDIGDDDMELAAEKAGYFGMAQSVVHNPAPESAQTFLTDVLARASHPKGHRYSIPLDKNMQQHSSSCQRAVNTAGMDIAAARDLSNQFGESIGGLSSFFMEVVWVLNILIRHQCKD